MNIKHTQEMWTEFERRRDVKLVDGYFVVPLREEDYKRARACVNACDGMTTEFLESFPNVCFAANTTEYASIMIERDTLKQQHAELLAELELAKTDAHNKSLRIQELHSRNAEMKAKIEDMAKGEDDGIR